MILKIRVIPRASRNLIQKEQDYLKIHLTEPAQDGLANKQLIELLAEHLGVQKYKIRVAKGQNSRDKLIEVSD